MLDHEEAVDGVRVVRWNPERPDAVTGELSRVNNFGDLLGPLLVARLAQKYVRSEPAVFPERPRLLAVGSVLHLAEDSDVVWGSGVNGKISRAQISAKNLDVRSVRGPHTREILRSLGHHVPEIYGDPALLLPLLFPQAAHWALTKTRSMTVVPNINDMDAFDPDDPDVLSPRGDLWAVVRAIAESEFVVGSSLHAIIIAEALGIPARPVMSAAEHYLKYVDYFAGTGRTHIALATDVAEAVKLGGVPSGSFDADGLLDSFPSDLWTGYIPQTSPNHRSDSHGRDLTTLSDAAWNIQTYDSDPAGALRDLFELVVAGPLLRGGPNLAQTEVQALLETGAAFLDEFLPELPAGNAIHSTLIKNWRSGDFPGVRRLVMLQASTIRAEVRACTLDGDGLKISGLAHLDRPGDGVIGARIRLTTTGVLSPLEFEDVSIYPLSSDASALIWRARLSLAALERMSRAAWGATLIVDRQDMAELPIRLRASAEISGITRIGENKVRIRIERSGKGFLLMTNKTPLATRATV